jgi:hypothetical protein
MNRGYARVSTDGQSVDAQVRQLRAAGAEKVYRLWRPIHCLEPTAQSLTPSSCSSWQGAIEPPRNTALAKPGTWQCCAIPRQSPRVKPIGRPWFAVRQMKVGREPQSIAEGLTVPERTLLFCIDSGTDWQKASSVTGVTVTAMVLKDLVDRDAVGRLTLTGEGRAALAALLKDHG